jgi:hypothetical protein
MNSGVFSFLKTVAPGLVGVVSIIGVTMISGSLALGASIKPSAAGLKPTNLAITARPIEFFQKGDRSRRTFGKLVWRGGLVLTAASENFGGLSGLLVSEDGRSLLAVSDAGAWMRGRLAYDGDRLTGIEGATLGPITGLDGKPLKRHRDVDAEALALSSGTIAAGEVYIAFENNHRIGRYAVTQKGLGRPLQYLEPPPGLKKAGRDGLEAMTVIAGGPNKGKLVAFSENAAAGGNGHAGWIWVGGVAKPLSVTTRGGFALTGAASLKDGSILLLERRFTILEGVSMRIRHIAADRIAPGAVLDGETLIESDLGYEIDNMEGLAVHTQPDGRTVLTIVSDDNFNPLLQRTILLQFELADAPRS